MKKQILLSMLLAMFTVASWGQEGNGTLRTDNLESSEGSNVYAYLLKNGHFRRMTSTTGATETWYNSAEFAFYAVDSDEEDNLCGVPENMASVDKAYKIYCITSQKWLSFDPKETGGYSVGVNFVKLVDDRKDAGYFYINKRSDFPDVEGYFYEIKPYNKTDNKYTVSTKYLNWVGSKNNYPNDNPNVTVGLDGTFDASTIGACWLLETVSDVHRDNVKQEDKDWVTLVSKNIGEQFGMYNYAISQADFEAHGEAVQNAQTFSTAAEAAKAHRASLFLNGMREGCYYTFKNSLTGLYLGIGSQYQCELVHRDGDKNIWKEEDGSYKEGSMPNEYNPAVVWKYEKKDDGYCLRNVYSHLYPLELSVEGAKTYLGTSNRYGFSYMLDDISDNGVFTWNIYIGDKRICCGMDGMTHQGLGDSSHYIISEVAGSDETFEQECVHRFNLNPKRVNDKDLPAPIDIESDDEIIIAPVALGDIHALQKCFKYFNLKVEEANQNSIWMMFEAIIYYKDNGALYGVKDYLSGSSLGSLKYQTPGFNENAPADSIWATICVPTEWSSIPGWTRYKCSSIIEDNLQFNLESGGGRSKANVPYIVKIHPDYAGKTYRFIYKEDNMLVKNPQTGYLVGVYESSRESENGKVFNVPVSDEKNDRYVLAKQTSTGTVAFFRVSEKATNLYMKKHQCYLEVPRRQNPARYSVLFFCEVDDDVETGIDNVLDTEDAVQGNNQYNGKIYNMSGQRLNRMQKGLNIVNGKIVIK